MKGFKVFDYCTYLNWCMLYPSVRFNFDYASVLLLVKVQNYLKYI